MDVLFRRAVPDDVEAAVPLIHSSGPDAWDYVFAGAGTTAQDFLAYAFVDGAGEFGWQNHTVGEVDGRVIATGAAYTGTPGFRWTLAAARQIVGHYGVASGGVMGRGLRTERIITTPDRDEWYLGHLGVEPSMRGNGIGSRLVEHLIAGAPPVSGIALHVAETNPRAQALYERLGFEVTDERGPGPANDFGRVVVHRRMARST